MLQFRQNDTAVSVILTLTELLSLNDPYYLFVFTHVTTKEEVAFVKAQSDDLSAHQDRYNEFELNPSLLFAGKQPGEWHYRIYEQASSSNIDPVNAGSIIEDGKLKLDRSVDFDYSGYQSGTTFKAYNG